MAPPNVNLKKGHRKPTAQQLADLKAAKKRGLTTIDIRDIKKNGLSSYHRSLAAKFKGLSTGSLAVANVTPAAAKRYKNEGLTTVGSKVLVPKARPGDKVVFSKKTGELRKYHATLKREIPLLPTKPRALKKGEQYHIIFKNKYGTTSKDFDRASDVADFLSAYPASTDYLEIEVQIY